MKKILVIHYSQSGQLTAIMEKLCAGLNGEIDFIRYRLKSDFPFPWPSMNTFFDAMPESVLEEPMELEPLVFKEKQYDLIIVGYQPWYLSPSIPITSLFHYEEFTRMIQNTPVITVIGSRNMWLNAQESIKRSISKFGGRLVANIPLIDRSPNQPSVVSITHWMLTGKKEKKYGIFPKPGVSNEDIEDVIHYAPLINQALEEDQFSDLQYKILKRDKIGISTEILFIEERAKRIFLLWARLIKKKQNRAFWVKFFKIYLVTALFVVAPILLLLYSLLVRPFVGASIRRKKAYFCGLDLKD